MAVLYKDGSVGLTSCPCDFESSAGIIDYHLNNDKSYCARIEEIIYPENEKNTTNKTKNKQIQYTVCILEGPRAGTRIYNVIDGQSFGDGLNSYERIRRATTDPKKGGPSATLRDTDGEIVIVQALGGNQNRWIITGGLSSPKHNDNVPKEEDGICSRSELNGVIVTIDKDGGQTTTYRGPKDENGNYSSDAPKCIVTVDKDGGHCIANGANKIQLDKDGQFSAVTGSSEMAMDNSGGMSIKSTVCNMNAKNALNIKSVLTQIGSSAVPSARIGDMAIGVGNLGAPVVSTIVGGSFIALIGA